MPGAYTHQRQLVWIVQPWLGRGVGPEMRGWGLGSQHKESKDSRSGFGREIWIWKVDLDLDSDGCMNSRHATPRSHASGAKAGWECECIQIYVFMHKCMLYI